MTTVKREIPTALWLVKITSVDGQRVSLNFANETRFNGMPPQGRFRQWLETCLYTCEDLI